jgi:competence protein ComEA
MAGGLTAAADAAAANMAAILRDGQQIHFPSIQQSVSLPERFSGAILVNVNTADNAALESLPGIGDVTAKAIIAYRETYGAFEVLDDLLFVDGIGPAVLEEIRPFITIQ